MNCRANMTRTLQFAIKDTESNRSCVIHLPMRFKHFFDDLGITDDPRMASDFNINKPILENNAGCLNKFSEIVFELSDRQMEHFTRLAQKSNPKTFSDLLKIAIDVSDSYNSICANNSYSLGKGFFNFLLMTGSKEITDMRDDDFEEFGKYIAEKTGGFFFDNCFYYKK